MSAFTTRAYGGHNHTHIDIGDLDCVSTADFQAVTQALQMAVAADARNLDTAWIILCSAFPDAPAPSPRCVPHSLCS